MRRKDSTNLAPMVSNGTTEGAYYTAEEEVFLMAVRAYQEANGRKFPTFVEVLRVAKSLGYRKVAVQ